MPLIKIQSRFDGQPQKNDVKEKKDDNNGKRKLGVFLNGAVAGSIAAGVWTYGDLKKESLQAATEISEIVEAELFHENQEKTTIITPTRRERFNFIADVVAETGSALVYIEGLYFIFSLWELKLNPIPTLFQLDKDTFQHRESILRTKA